LTAMTLSGHKVGAPIGVGALVVARSAKPISLVHGGGQERSLRSGTMNYPFGCAEGPSGSGCHGGCSFGNNHSARGQ
jgi:cysteine desulfurase